MKPSYFLPFLLILSIFGSGCASRTKNRAEANRTEMPTLKIISPANETKTNDSSIEITGNSNMDEIFINGRKQAVVNSIFKTDAELKFGKNSILIFAGNGYTTTTMNLLIERTE